MIKEKILILYHSGAGSTKFTAEIMADRLRDVFNITIRHINFYFEFKTLFEFDLIVFGFPTYHCEPSTSMMDFIKQIPKLKNPVKTFFFTSFGLYTGNCLRIFYEELNKKNFDILGYFQFKSPASDGVLMFPSRFKFMFKFGKNYPRNIEDAVSQIKNYKNLPVKRKPLFKWYVPLNEIVKYYGEKEYMKMRNKMHIIENRCTNCNLCVENCERNSWISNKTTPVFEPENCEFCLECIHKCPHNAIVFSEKMKDKSRLNNNFFNNLKKQYI